MINHLDQDLTHIRDTDAEEIGAIIKASVGHHVRKAGGEKADVTKANVQTSTRSP